MWYCTVHTLSSRVPGLKMGKTIGNVLLTPGADSTSSTGSTLMVGRSVGRSLITRGWPPGCPLLLLLDVDGEGHCRWSGGTLAAARGSAHRPQGEQTPVTKNWGGEACHNIKTL